MEKRKPPLAPRRVMADDITVEVGGETYHPHAGEYVEFKGRPSVGLYLKVAQLGESPEALMLLVENLHAWTLTDDGGNEYPNPPALDSLLRMPGEELGWLLKNVSTVGIGDEALGNVPTPST